MLTQTSTVKHCTLSYQTKAAFDIIDITDDVASMILESGIKEGIVTVYTQHTTTAIKINENEVGFFADLKKLCEKLVPRQGDYLHNDLAHRAEHTLCAVGEECLNGHSHLLQMFLGTASETVPVSQGQMQLGTWQRILFVELDCAKSRNLKVTVMGV